MILFCVDRPNKHNVVDIWKSGISDSECCDSQPLLDEPDVPATSTDICQWSGLLDNDAARRWRHQWTGKHNVCRIVGNRPRSIPSTSYTSSCGSYSATSTDSLPTSTACRHWWSDRHSDRCRNHRQICHRSVASIVAICRFPDDDTPTSSVYC